MMMTTFRLTKKSAVLGIVAGAVLLAAIVLACSVHPAEDIGTLDGRVAYLTRLGWEVDPLTEEKEVIVLPREFEGVMLTYNKMQLAQGFDLSRYAGMECIRYSYRVTNYPSGDPNVLAQIFVCGTRVIGGDIHSTALDGFMHGIK